MALIFHAPADLEAAFTPTNISVESLIEILDSGVTTSGSSSFKVVSTDPEDRCIDLSVSSSSFERDILSTNTIGFSLRINGSYLCLSHVSNLKPLQLYEAASGDDSSDGDDTVPGPMWEWINGLNEELSSTKLIVVDIGDNEPDLRLCLLREIYFGQCILHSAFLGEVAEFVDHLALLFDKIESIIEG
jgi:hypothetical protein